VVVNYESLCFVTPIVRIYVENIDLTFNVSCLFLLCLLLILIDHSFFLLIIKSFIF